MEALNKPSESLLNTFLKSLREPLRASESPLGLLFSRKLLRSGYMFRFWGPGVGRGASEKLADKRTLESIENV